MSRKAPPKELKSLGRSVSVDFLVPDRHRAGVAESEDSEFVLPSKGYLLPLLVALAGWILLFAFAHQMILPGFCSAVAGSLLSHYVHGLAATFLINPTTDLTLLWAAILLTTMPLLVAGHIAPSQNQNTARRRYRAIGLFAAGYGTVWMVVGLGLMALAIGINMIVDANGVQTIMPAIGIALLWQFSPSKQACLQRCRGKTGSAGFAFDTDIEYLRCGLTTAVWCAGAWWAMLLIPLTAEGIYAPVTAIVAALAFYECLEPT
jgi:predicted metal-binding membrane protein